MSDQILSYQSESKSNAYSMWCVCKSNSIYYAERQQGVVVGEKDDELTRRDFRAPYIGAICREVGCAGFKFEQHNNQAEAFSRDLIDERDATRFSLRLHIHKRFMSLQC